MTDELKPCPGRYRVRLLRRDDLRPDIADKALRLDGQVVTVVRWAPPYEDSDQPGEWMGLVEELALYSLPASELVSVEDELRAEVADLSHRLQRTAEILGERVAERDKWMLEAERLRAVLEETKG